MSSIRRSDPEGLPASSPDHVPRRPAGRTARLRGWFRQHPRLRVAWRIAIGIAGTAIVLVGLLLVPLPGPGWLIVFAGLWVLGLEFAAPRRLAKALRRALDHLARRVARWRDERRRQRGR